MNESIQIQQLRDSNLLLRRTIAFLCATGGGSLEIDEADIVKAGDPNVIISKRPEGGVRVELAPEKKLTPTEELTGTIDAMLNELGAFFESGDCGAVRIGDFASATNAYQILLKYKKP